MRTCVTIGHDHNHRLNGIAGNQVLYDLNHPSSLRPRALIAVDTMKEVKDRKCTIWTFTIYHLDIRCRQVDVYAAIDVFFTVVPFGLDEFAL